MKSLMSFVFLMPMILTAAPSRAESVPAVIEDRCRPDAYCPNPLPYPRYCPDGTHRVFDEYTGRYICVDDDNREPQPLPWRKDRMEGQAGVLGAGHAAAGITAELGKGNTLKASEGLDGLFSGSAVKGSGSSAGTVYAGAGNASPGLARGIVTLGAARTPFASRKRGVPAPIFRNVECGDKDGCKSETGKVVEDATKPIRDAIDNLGDRLRDRNDEKLREGTQRQRDAEKEQKEKKERERPTV